MDPDMALPAEASGCSPNPGLLCELWGQCGTQTDPNSVGPQTQTWPLVWMSPILKVAIQVTKIGIAPEAVWLWDTDITLDLWCLHSLQW